MSRRLYQIGKSFLMIRNMVEHHQIVKLRRAHPVLLDQNLNLNSATTYFVNFIFALFHLLMNLTVLRKIGFLDESWIKYKRIKALTNIAWSIGLVVQLFFYINKLIQNFKKYDLAESLIVGSRT